MQPPPRSLRIAFIHPDLGIGGAERLVVDAALGLQALGHSLDIYTSHHDPHHCFDETKDGRLKVCLVKPPFPRSFKGKFHILFAHARQLHLTAHLLLPSAPRYDVYFVDQLSTCIPFLRALNRTRVVFYCHFPDKLLANGEFVEDALDKNPTSILKRIYRYPMDWLEEITTGQADTILVNSKFTARVFKSYFPSIVRTPTVVYPGINIDAYQAIADVSHPDIVQISSTRPTLLSLNRFERKKNVALAISAFALLKTRFQDHEQFKHARLVIAGGYDSRLEDNMMTIVALIDRAKASALTYNIVTPSTSQTRIPPFNCTTLNPDILFLLNFTTAQRSALLHSGLALLYTPTNEHFGIGPVEGMLCGLPVVACNSGGPTESVLCDPAEERTGWLCPPDPQAWAEALFEILVLTPTEREVLSQRSRTRAREMFGMHAMARGIETALQETAAKGLVHSAWSWISLSVMCLVVAYVLGRRVLTICQS